MNEVNVGNVKFLSHNWLYTMLHIGENPHKCKNVEKSSVGKTRSFHNRKFIQYRNSEIPERGNTFGLKSQLIVHGRIQTGKNSNGKEFTCMSEVNDRKHLIQS
jgi:hypothetical protein